MTSACDEIQTHGVSTGTTQKAKICPAQLDGTPKILESVANIYRSSHQNAKEWWVHFARASAKATSLKPQPPPKL